MPIYTKKGDRGTSSVISTPKGTRIAKSSAIFDALGAIDELNSFLGIITAETENNGLVVILEKIQNDLFSINSYLAGASIKIGNFGVARMENDIDKMTADMPSLTNFILPGGTKISAQLHYCRTLTRRAERRLVELSGEQKVKSSVLKYINRLSDYFFTLARWNNYINNTTDKPWRLPK